MNISCTLNSWLPLITHAIFGKDLVFWVLYLRVINWSVPDSGMHMTDHNTVWYKVGTILLTARSVMKHKNKPGMSSGSGLLAGTCSCLKWQVGFVVTKNRTGTQGHTMLVLRSNGSRPPMKQWHYSIFVFMVTSNTIL